MTMRQDERTLKLLIGNNHNWRIKNSLVDRVIQGVMLPIGIMIAPARETYQPTS